MAEAMVPAKEFLLGGAEVDVPFRRRGEYDVESGGHSLGEKGGIIGKAHR